jgi:hypothetical protein
VVAPPTLKLSEWITDLKNLPPASLPRNNGHLTPAKPEVQTEFRRLMAGEGVQPKRGGQELVRCPWHADTRASLSVNWEAAVFNCQSCDKQGGLRRLRQIVGEPDLRKVVRGAASIQTSNVPPAGQVHAGLKLDAERERLRLAGAMKQAGLSEFNRATGRALYETVIECHRAFSKYECPNDGKRKVRASSCGFRLCPSCLPSRLRADFRRHRDNLPDRVSLYVWKPNDANASLSRRRDTSDAFKRWRRDQGLTAGFYGVRAKLRNGVANFDVLLVLPSGVTLSDGNVTAVAEKVDLDAAIEWYVQMFLEEAVSWRTPEEMLDLRAAVKGNRRFQGFGQHYGRSESVGEKQLSSDTPKRLGKVAAGSGKGGGREPVLCDCGARMRFVGMALTKEEADAWVEGATTKLSDYKCSEASL